MSRLRIAMSGCSHWHRELYLHPLREMTDAQLVAVSDRDSQAAALVAREYDCEPFDDLGDLCDRAQPDFVFALGRHCDMPSDADVLIRKKIGFAIEKPAGRSAVDVARLASAAASAGVFAAVPFVFRQSEFFGFLASSNYGDLTNASFRFIAGPPTRYLESGCAWMLEPNCAGGGCTINLSIHFIDLLFALKGKPVEVRTASMSTTAFGLDVEDHSFLSLTSDGASCLVETGYLFPAPTSVFDMRFSLRFTDAYVIAVDAEHVVIARSPQDQEVRTMGTTNVSAYPAFVRDVLKRFQVGDPPSADLSDLEAAMQVVDQAYAIARSSGVLQREVVQR